MMMWIRIKIFWNLIKFTIAAGVKMITDSMKEEAQTYKEERELQKKIKKNDEKD
jgi:hypothetical protein